MNNIGAAGTIAAMGASMTSFISDHSMTGYPLIDTLIIANIVPMVMGYINQMTAFITWLITTVSMWLSTTIQEYVRIKTRTYTVGTELIEVKINSNHYLHAIIQTQILDNPDMLTDCYDFYGMDTSNIKLRITHDIFRYEITETPYDRMEFTEKLCLQTGKSKSFKWRDYIVRIIRETPITIHLVGRTKIPREECIRQIQEFLIEKCGIDKFPRYYGLRINSASIANHIINNNTRIVSDTFTNAFIKTNIISKTILKNLTLTAASIHMRDMDYTEHVKISNHDGVTSDSYNGVSSGLLQRMKGVDEAVGNIPPSTLRSIMNIKLPENMGIMNDTVIIKFDVIYNLVRLNINAVYCDFLYIISNTTLTEDDIRRKIADLITYINGLTQPTLLPAAIPVKQNISLFKRGAISNNTCNWTQHIVEPRNFENIYLSKEVFSDVRKEMDDFISKEKLYRAFQIPYKKGILLYGPPGTGKTTLIKCLAYEYQINIYMIDVNDADVTDETILYILASIGSVSGTKILLFEDIDSAFANKETLQSVDRRAIDFVPLESNYPSSPTRSASDESGDQLKKAYVKPVLSKKYLTYSGLLNALDGVLNTQVGVITIMTTNYLEKLGTALVRPGRIDKKFELRECNHYQIESMTKGYINKAKTIDASYYKGIAEEYITENAKKFADNLIGENGYARNHVRPCELQCYLLKYIDDLPALFSNYHELLLPRE